MAEQQTESSAELDDKEVRILRKIWPTVDISIPCIMLAAILWALYLLW